MTELASDVGLGERVRPRLVCSSSKRDKRFFGTVGEAGTDRVAAVIWDSCVEVSTSSALGGLAPTFREGTGSNSKS